MLRKKRLKKVYVLCLLPLKKLFFKTKIEKHHKVCLINFLFEKCFIRIKKDDGND